MFRLASSQVPGRHPPPRPQVSSADLNVVSASGMHRVLNAVHPVPPGMHVTRGRYPPCPIYIRSGLGRKQKESG